MAKLQFLLENSILKEQVHRIHLWFGFFTQKVKSAHGFAFTFWSENYSLGNLDSLGNPGITKILHSISCWAMLFTFYQYPWFHSFEIVDRNLSLIWTLNKEKSFLTLAIRIIFLTFCNVMKSVAQSRYFCRSPWHASMFFSPNAVLFACLINSFRRASYFSSKSLRRVSNSL